MSCGCKGTGDAPPMNPNDYTVPLDKSHEKPPAIYDPDHLLLGDYTKPVEAEDPWQHRAEHMKCHSCMWYAAKAISDANQSEVGRCRRHAPTLAGFPVVYAFKDWCGDHKLDEEKL